MNVHHDSDLRYSTTGRAFFVDTFEDESTVDETTISLADDVDGNEEETDGGEKVPLTELPIFESLPGATNVFYLDFTGDIVTGTDWNVDFENQPIHALPFDKDGDTTTFSRAEIDIIHEVWQRVSEDYLPFDINVTTAEPEDSPLIRSARTIITRSEDDASMGGTGEVWFPDAGGVAYVGGWVTNRDAPAWVFHNSVPKTAKGIAEAAAHEFGHLVGLSHHGDADSQYYGGHGKGETSWAPIMGAGYNQSVTHWSLGKYAGATNQQDDISIITNRFNDIHIREDDHDNDGTELTVGADGRITASGIIETRSDYDTFILEHPGGPLSLQVRPAAVGGNLDIAVVLYSDIDDELIDYNPQETRSVSITDDFEAGVYYFEVEGIGHLPDDGQGYSDYGSLGAYTIEAAVGQEVLVADAGNSYDIDEGTTLTLDASLSFGTSETSTFAWDLDEDGEFDDAFGKIVELTWEQLGELPEPIIDQTERQIAVEVQAGENRATAFASLTVNNVAPQVETEPVETFVNAPAIMGVTAQDIAADTLLFEWNFGDDNSTITTSATVIHTYSEPGEYTVMVNVGDDEGALTPASFVVTVNPPLPGDADYDGEVTFSDFLVLSGNFGNQEMTWTQGDFDDDGIVGFADFLLLSTNFAATIDDNDF